MTAAADDPTDLFTAPAVETIRRADGTILFRSLAPLKEYGRCIGERLEYWAGEAPDRLFLAERDASGAWRGVTYREALDRVYGIGAWLLEHHAMTPRPVMVLSENSVEHGLLMLACLHVGIPIAPISPAYSLLSSDFVKLAQVVETVRPGIIYVADQVRFGRALAAVRDRHTATLVVGGDRAPADGALSFASLAERPASPAVEHAFRAISPDTVAKLLFTSGSTDEPKAVINTQRMLCSNQRAIRELWPFLREPPVLLDWLPWHHTFGGNHNFNLVVWNGGTLYIDRGRPVPGGFDETLRNLREVPPTAMFNVPRAYDFLVTALRGDRLLRERFFSRLRLMFYAAAALPEHTWEALYALSIETLGRPVPLVSSWGLTETAPAATSCHYQAEQSGVIGLPMPGCELKLVPRGDRIEARVRGPNVTPGYYDRPELTAGCFDEEGFFKTGDAVRFVDPDRPELGLSFDGRLGENFKLTTATWVHVGSLRLKAIEALAPVAQDVVIAGHGRDQVGFLIVPRLDECRRASGLPEGAALGDILGHPSVRLCVASGLRALAQAGGGSSTYATRALFLEKPLSIDEGELTDKGYVNQRAVLTRHQALVDRLYATPLDESVIILPEPRDTKERASNF
jgi:feruloyl-CoA synthase